MKNSSWSVLPALLLMALVLVLAPANAAIVSVSSDTLASNPGSYSNLDGSGTSLAVTFSAGGSLTTIAGGIYEGLWFGGNQDSATYTLYLQPTARLLFFSRQRDEHV